MPLLCIFAFFFIGVGMVGQSIWLGIKPKDLEVCAAKYNVHECRYVPMPTESPNHES